ncbi:GATA transcription factor 8-like [Senna tora]|uniref:GATA transcription factor 8-like n=1 Tax=Senna tora TaxID=362788 RepID=A0A834SYZ2_9FABA|nr:GATA transcription factor 8-like [Senna tora]
MIEQDETDFGGFFDHIDDLLDFPADDVDVGAASFPAATMTCPSIWPAVSDPVFSGNSSPELSMPYEDIVQLEWLPNFVDYDPSCGSLTLEKVEQKQNQFQTFSPVSVLERGGGGGGSSSSSSGEKNAPCSPEIYIPVPSCVRGARSKRPRPATFNPRSAMQCFISPAALSVGENTIIMTLPNNAISKTSSDSDQNFAESRPLIKKKKKKARSSHHNIVASQEVRKCMHCEITKTPQWRAGPFGPKSLCNACGVRYKSGRLFPEYRPAASPTFCPSLHSNSHQKVLEMRSKSGEVTAAAAAASMEVHSADATPEVLIPNTDGSLTLEYMAGINGRIGAIDDDDDNIIAFREGL